jgi:hypothetical protein
LFSRSEAFGLPEPLRLGITYDILLSLLSFLGGDFFAASRASASFLSFSSTLFLSF